MLSVVAIFRIMEKLAELLMDEILEGSSTSNVWHILSSVIDFDNQPNQFGIDIGKLGYLSPYLDGKNWCVLHGDNIQSGVCGFGSTPKEATDNFISEILKSERNRIWEGILKHPDIEQNDRCHFDNDDEIYEVIFKQ